MKIPTHLQMLALPPTTLTRAPAAPAALPEQPVSVPADQVDIGASALQGAPAAEAPSAPREEKPAEKPAPSAEEKKAEQRAELESRMRAGSSEEYHFADSNLNLRAGGDDPKVKVKLTPKRNGGSAEVKLDHDGQGVDLSGIKVSVGKKPGIGLTWDF